MSLTPEDVERKVFKQEFRGYSQAEVDVFLDLVTERLIELGRERDLLLTRLRDAERHANERVARVEAYAEERIAEIEKRASEAIETEQHLKRALVTAERAADETLQTAQGKAEETLVHANAQADQTLAEARREADQILSDSHQQAAAMLVDARKRTTQAQETCRSEADRIQRTVATFTTLRDEYRSRVRRVVEEYLARFDEAGELPEVPPQLIDLAAINEPTWTDLSDRGIMDPSEPCEGSRGNIPEALLEAEQRNGEPPAEGERVARGQSQ
ncbi:MAG: DivIVA domain-containing protein [Egibacteraceae bacterium]